MISLRLFLNVQLKIWMLLLYKSSFVNSIHTFFDAVLAVPFGSPNLFCFEGNVWLTDLGVVLRQWFEHHFLFGARQRNNLFGKIKNRGFHLGCQCSGLGMIGQQQSINPSTKSST